MNGPRAADDFATIRARLEELRREREQAKPSEKDAQPDPLLPRGVSVCRRPSQTNAGRDGFPRLALVRT